MPADAKQQPNILAIIADDLGWFDVGAYHRGVMGTQTPNIDRIARDGAMLLDADAQASCTAGRAAFITGQIPIRTGLTAVGLPGAPQGLKAEDPTLADLLKPLAGATLKPTVPRPVNLRNDPFEQHMDAPVYPLYAGSKLWTVMPAAYLLQMHAATFKEFPPRQAPAGFNPADMLNGVLKTAAEGIGN